jgi:uncharacterized membrane protein
MGKTRLEAFSDGVLAILITIMVLELKVPHGSSFSDLVPVLPTFLSYVLSFIYIGIYWNNHHHMLHTVTCVSASILWANLHLLFWLSLFPFVTAWMGENHFDSAPAAAYGIVMLGAGIAYFVLQRRIIVAQGENSLLKRAIGRDLKGKLSPILYLLAIISTLFEHRIAFGLYILVAIMWFIPDKRIERVVNGNALTDTEK